MGLLRRGDGGELAWLFWAFCRMYVTCMGGKRVAEEQSMGSSLYEIGDNVIFLFFNQC